MKSGLFDDLIEQPTESPSESTYQSKSGLFQDEVTATPADYYTKPVDTPSLTQVEPVKPTFKTFFDLTFKEKAKLGTAKITKGWYGGSLGAVAGLIESVSTGKDFLKGAFTSSTVSEELAKDTTFDKNVKKLANLYSNQADITSDELKNTKISLGLNPEDTFVDQLLQGTGYLTNFIATGAPTKMATMAIGFGKYAGAVANSLNVASESLMEAQDVYKEAKANGKSDMEAYEATRNTLASNALLIGLTNKVSGIFEDTAYKGLKRLFKIGASGTVEGLQEGLQKMVSNYNTDKPLFQGVKDSFLIGASLGVPMAVAFDTGSKQGKEEVQKIIDESPATEEQKQVATDILNGVATEEQKQAVLNEAITNETLNISLDETNKEALKEDIQGMVAQGANIGDIVIALQAEGISQNDAENIVAEVIATPEATAVVEEVVKPKATPKKVVAQEAVKTPTKQEILDDENVPKARKMAIEEIDYYLGASEAGRRQFTLEKDSYDYKVTVVPSTFPQFVPENMRSRKAFDRLQPYWEKQERPSNKTPMLQKLYDIFQNEVEKSVPENQKKIDEQMAQEARGDGLEFKTRKTTATREMAVLDDFKKRYKVQFPTLIVSKIIEGKKTELHPKGDGEAEGATDGNTIALAFDAIINTGKHELIHLTLNNLDQIPELAKFSRQDILKAQAKKMGVELTKENEKTVEEQLALDFEAYQNKTYKPNNSTIAKFFASIRDMINNFRGVIVKSDGDVITQYYDAVLYGETARKQEVAITTESNVARYLIDNVLDYRPMYQTRRVLSLSNGITSVDFKVEEEQDLIVHHNLTEKNLLHTDKLGGLPVPSIAISNKDNVTSGFGDIILVGNKDLIDPKIKTNKAFNADSYSARYPKINYYVKDKKALDDDFKKVKEYFTDPEILRSHESGFYTLSDGVGDYGIEGLYRSRGVKAMFAIEKGASKDSTRNEIDDIASNNRDEFEKFADKIADKLDIQSSIYNGYTASGNRRSGIPHTLENVVKKMKGSGRTDEKFNYGVGSLRSAVAKKFKNIKEIQADRKKLISEEEMSKLKDETSKQFFDLMDKHNVDDYFRFADNIVDYELGRISKAQFMQYTGIDEQAVQEFEDFGKYLAGLPSEYFEVKMQRAVKLNEFKLAIVPEEISKEAEDILTKNGLIVKKYNKENRQEVIASNNEVFFKERQPKFKDALNKSLDVYKESGDLTTKILKDLEGKTTVSKQYILDATNRGDVKQVEKDIIRDLLFFERDTIKVKDFAFKVQQELLPLYIKSSDNIVPNEDQDYNPFTMNNEGGFTPKWEFVNLPTNLRGDVEGYVENIYESPIPTVAGKHHYNYLTNNYFGHTRAEDVPNNVRRIIEVQSDLYQRNRMEEESRQAKEILANPTYQPENKKNFTNPEAFDLIVSEAKNRLRDVAKLEQYNDPTAHFRMIREEIRSATLDGKDVLQFPTGETAMKIEGLGNSTLWALADNTNTRLMPDTLEVGREIIESRAGETGEDLGNTWIITDVLGDGKFKAVQKDKIPKFEYMSTNNMTRYETFSGIRGTKEGNFTKEDWIKENAHLGETFDISGKVDTNNPIYKFYEKEVGRYLKNNYKAEIVTDNKGVTWYEVKLKDEYKGAVVAFKERVSRADNEEYIKKTYPKYYEAIRAKLPPQKASRAFDRAKARLQEQFQFDTTYTTIKIADEMAKAMEVVAQNPDYARKVALGLEEAPLDVTDTAISLAVAETAKEKGDYQLQADSEKERSLRQSRRGQEIVMEKGRVDENSSDYFIKQVLDRRKELIAQKYKPFMKKAKPFLELLDEVKENKIKKNKKIKSDLELKIEDFDNFLMEMAC